MSNTQNPFSTDILNLLEQPLDTERISTRSQSGRQLSYLETWDVIATANQIFGYDGWTYAVQRIDPDQFGVQAIVMVRAGGVIRSDVGYCAYAIRQGETEPRAQAVETAIKGAVSDGLKRAMRSFGDQFGNSLYDKDNPDRADNQGRSQQGRQSAPRNQQGNRGNQQQSQPAQPAQPKDISVDQEGNEVLSGRALGFKNWVEFNGVEWLGFLENVLYAPTLAGYYESGGNPTGAIAAFRQHMADMGEEIKNMPREES